MLVVRIAEEPADPVCELVSAEQSLGLRDLAFGVDPLGLYGVKPRALGGQEARHYTYPTAACFDPAVVGGDPTPHPMALVPARIVPDQQQGLFAHSLEPSAAPLEKLRGYGAHRAAIYEPKPALLKFRQIEAVAGEGLRLGIAFLRLFLEEAQRVALLSPRVHSRPLEARKPGLILEANSPLGMALGQPDQPISIPFFLSYCGSGLSIQRLALCQRTPSLESVARMVSPLTRLSVMPSSKPTSAAKASVQKVPSLPKTRWGGGGASAVGTRPRLRRRLSEPLWDARSRLGGRRGHARRSRGWRCAPSGSHTRDFRLSEAHVLRGRWPKGSGGA